LKIVVEETDEDRKESANKFSKTLGHEKKLDQILSQLKNEQNEE